MKAVLDMTPTLLMSISFKHPIADYSKLCESNEAALWCIVLPVSKRWLSVIHLLCTDNGKHLLMFKLMYILCLLTVKAGNITD